VAGDAPFEPKASVRVTPPDAAQSSCARSNSVAYDEVRSASSIAGCNSSGDRSRTISGREHNHDVFHNFTSRGYEYEIHRGRIKQLWTGQAVVMTSGSGQPTIAQTYHPQESRQ